MKSKLLTAAFFLYSIFLFAQTPQRPFPQHVVYTAGSIKPSNYTQSQLDNIVKEFYNQWKSVYLKDDCGTDQYYVWFDEESSNNSICVSEGQGYGMMITAFMAGYDPDAKEYFDGLYHFYKAHPSINDNYLMAWNQIEGCIEDPDGGDGSAADGDLDIAFALLFADKQWGSEGTINYLAEALSIIEAIKQHDVNQNLHIPLLGDWVFPGYSEYNDSRPSDFMPDHFRAFQNATGDISWENISNTCYGLISEMQDNYSPATGLLPDFIENIDSGPEPAEPYYLEGEFDGDYYYNACRVPLRITIDYLTSGDIRGKNAVQEITAWIRNKTGNDPTAIHAGYYLNGNDLPDNDYESAAFIGPFTVAAMADAANQNWLNDAHDFLLTLALQDYGYFDNTLKLICLLISSGNYWVPQQTAGITDEKFPGSLVINVFPNPFGSVIAVSANTAVHHRITLTISDVFGATCYKQEIDNPSNSSSQSLDLDFLTAGTYFLKAEIDGSLFVTRIIKLYNH
jgi:endo-1,4-beta-D-glucanase Y